MAEGPFLLGIDFGTGGARVGIFDPEGTPIVFSEREFTLEGAAAIEVIGGALLRLAERGIIGPGDFPLMRHLHSVVASDEPLDMPWSTFFGGEPGRKG